MKKLYTFYILVITQGLSMVGSRMTSVAVGIWLFKKTGNASPILLVSFFNEIPGIFFSSISGALVDRVKRKYSIILGDTGQAIGTLILLVSIISNSFNVLLLYGVVFFQGIFATIQGPASSATVSLLVPESELDRANGVREMIFPVAGVVAPILTGMLYSFIGLVGIIVIDFVTFIAAFMVLLMIKIPNPVAFSKKPMSKVSLMKESLDGYSYIISKKPMLYLVIYYAVINFLLNGPLDLVIPYIIKITGKESTAGILLSIMSGGAFFGATLITFLKLSKSRVRTLIIGILVSGIMFIVFGSARNIIAVGGALFVLMAPLPISNAVLNSIIQTKTPVELQGRVFGAIAQLMSISAPASFLITGILADRLLNHRFVSLPAPIGSIPGIGISILLIGTGLIILFSSLFIYGNRQVRHLEKELPDCEVMI